MTENKLLQQISLSLFLLCLPVAIWAQIGRVGINTLSPTAMLHVKDSNVLFSGAFPLPSSPGATPVSGPGNRLMWYPDKAAFRVGLIDNAGWDRDSIGLYSFAAGANCKALSLSSIAMGNGNRASGNYSIALGLNNIASQWASVALGSTNKANGQFSVALGYGNISSGYTSMACGFLSQATGSYSIALGYPSFASGFGSIALGYQTQAQGSNAFAFGSETIASGVRSLAFGLNTLAFGANSCAFGEGSIASGVSSLATGAYTTALGGGSSAFGANTDASPYLSMAMGQYNIDVPGSENFWTSADPLLMVGNGTSSSSRNNAFTVLKNGNNGFNTATPDALTHTVRNNPTDGPYFGNVISIWESDLNSYVQFSNANTRECGFLSGNDDTAIRSALIFSADSSIVFNSGGNISKMMLTKNGFLGVGTLAPSDIFHIRKASSGATGNSNSVGIFENNSAAYLNILTPNANESGLLFGNVALSAHGGIIYNAASTPNGIQFRTNSNQTRMVINNTGSVGIGTTAPSEKLHVAGNICYTGSSAACSDIRYKKNFTPITNALTSLESIRGIYYNWKVEEFPDKEFNDKRQIGVVAQELEKVFPEMVQTDHEGYKSVDYSRLTPVLVEAIKDQQTQIDFLMKELAALKSQLVSMNNEAEPKE